MREANGTKIIFDNDHGCITLEELRYVLKRFGRYTPYYFLIVIHAVLGVRAKEGQHLSLYNLMKNGKSIKYNVTKPKNQYTSRNLKVKVTKERNVQLDEWTYKELHGYLRRNFKIVGNEYVSPWSDDVTQQKLFPWKNTKEKQGRSVNIINARWAKIREEMSLLGFDTKRKELETVYEDKTITLRVFRLHMLRHFACTVMYYKLGKDVKAVQDWIKHSKLETTQRYIHTAKDLGTTSEFLEKASWGSILGMEEATDLREYEITTQTNLAMWT